MSFDRERLKRKLRREKKRKKKSSTQGCTDYSRAGRTQKEERKNMASKSEPFAEQR